MLPLREVAIVGARYQDLDSIRSTAAMEGQNAFTASAALAAERVGRLPAVQRARVSVSLPDRALVEVTERAPLMVLTFSGGWLYADGSGALFAGDDQGREPLLEDETRSYRPGDRLPSGLVGIVRRVDILGVTGYFGSGIRRTRLTAAYGLVLALDRGTDVRLGTTEDFDRKLAVAQRIVLERAGKRLDYVDVRSPDRVVFFPQD
jgi:cell division septal protein FtsQ